MTAAAGVITEVGFCGQSFLSVTASAIYVSVAETD